MRALRVVDPYRPHPRPWVWIKRHPWHAALAALSIATAIALGSIR